MVKEKKIPKNRNGAEKLDVSLSWSTWVNPIL